MADQIDHYLPTHQGATPPVLRDVAKHPVLDFVPFAGPRRQVTYRNPQPDIIGQLLQLPVQGEGKRDRDSRGFLVPHVADRFLIETKQQENSALTMCMTQ